MANLIEILDGSTGWGPAMRANLAALNTEISTASSKANAAVNMAATRVRSVNEVFPDASGNVTLDIGGAVDSINGKTGTVTIDKADVGLSAVDNTADTDKPVSSAQGSAIAVKYTKPSGGIPYVDLDPNVATSIRDATQAYNDGRYALSTNFYVWSYANNPAGPGPGGVIIDPTAAPNVPRNSTAKRAEGYVAIGREALGAATRARACIAIGSLALGLGNPGFGNLAVGAFALSNVQGVSEFAADLPGSRNIGIGSLAGYFVSSGYMNTFVGRDSGQTATTGLRNTGLGYGAFSRGIAPVGIDGTIINQYPTTGSDNTAVGTQATGMLAGSNTVAVGSMAAYALRASDNNVFVGASAANLLGSTTSENGYAIVNSNIAGTYSQSGTTITVTATAHGAAVGKRVGLTFTSGQISTVTGEEQWMIVAAVPNANTLTVTSPVSQTASGNVTLARVESGTAASVTGANVVIGYQAQADATTTLGNNVYVGEQTARGATGSNNTTLGSRAGFNLTTGIQNTFVGFNAGRALSTGGGLTTQSNCSVLGQGGAPSGDNQVQLGNQATTTYVYGTVQNRSDLRDKADVRDTELGLDFINAVRPVDYRWDMREDYIEHDDDGNVVAVHERDGSKKRERFHHGVIAQELPEGFGGVQDHSIAGGEDIMSVGYDEFIAPLIKAVQELSAKVAELESRLASEG